MFSQSVGDFCDGKLKKGGLLLLRFWKEFNLLACPDRVGAFG